MGRLIMKRQLLYGVWLGCAIATPVWAVTVTPTGTILTVDYDEPTTNANSSPLTVLRETVVWYALGGHPAGVCVTTPAYHTTVSLRSVRGEELAFVVGSS